MEVLCRLSYSGGRRDDSNVPRARVVLVVVLLLVGACNRSSPAASSAYPANAHFTTRGGDMVLRVKVARTDAEKQRGLMNVRSLPASAGMAFVWTQPTQTAFWMKDTLIPLSIAFADERGRIVTISDMTPCTADPCPDYRSDAPFTVAIEANRGWFDDHGVSVGDRVELEFRQ
jgi:hypothetical protein